MATRRDTMLVPAIALLVTQVVHGAVPADTESDSPVGFYVGILLLAATAAAIVGLVQRSAWARPLAAWAGLVVAVGFVAYHAVPFTSALTNPYVGEGVGAAAWLSVTASVAAGLWCAYEGRAELRREPAPAG